MPISLTNFVTTTVTTTPQGLSIPNIANIAIFTTETPSNSDPFRVYLNAQSVAGDYGTSAVATSMAEVLFAQDFNILTAQGRLITIPLQSAVSATSGKFTSTDLSANLVSLALVSDGSLQVTVNGGTAIELTGLDFTNTSTWVGVASVFQAKLTDVIVYAITDGLVFESKKVGAISTIALAAGTGGTDLSVVGYLNVAGGTVTGGANASGETIAEAIDRIGEDVFYYAIVSDLEMEDSIITALATTIQARDQLFLHHFSDTNDLEGVITTLTSANNSKTRSLFYSPSKESANLMKVAYTSRLLSVDYTGSNTANTLHLKILQGVTPDVAINDNLLSRIIDAGADCYIEVSGQPKVFISGENRYSDEVVNEAWLTFAINTAKFNYLAQTNTKIPQSEEGMNGLKSAVLTVLERGVTNGVLTTGIEWSSPNTFGNVADLKRNIVDVGYYLYSQPIATQPLSERQNRQAPLMQVAAKLAGAIHSAFTQVILES